MQKIDRDLAQAIGYCYVIIDGSGSSLGGNVITHQFAQGSSITYGSNTFNILYNENATGTGAGNDVVLQLASVPGPTTSGMMLLGFGLLVGMQRIRIDRRS